MTCISTHQTNKQTDSVSKSKEKENLDKLRTSFEAHVRNIGEKSLERVSASSGDALVRDPKTYVHALLEVHQKYQALVQTAFKNDTGFMKALDKACENFVNRNKVANAGTSKSPELLAKYADALLKKSAKNPDENELETMLTQTMVIFKFIEDKDVFQKHYSRSLARRLINETSASDDAEASMISKLREACGVDFTSKLQRMFTDISLSKEQNDRFRDRLKQTRDDSEITVDFNFKVLGTSAWPLTAPSTAFDVPPEVEPIFRRFQTFYESAHQGRKLNWLFQHSRAEIRTTYVKHGRSGYTFQVSTYQMGVLLQYNKNTSYTAAELMESTKLNKETVNGILGIFCKSKLLQLESGQAGSDGARYGLNMDYKSKKMRQNLNIAMRAEVEKENKETQKSIDEDRKMLAQAAIVRIMKARKTLEHNQLVAEVIEQLKSRFNPEIASIKKCIDALIEKEYLERHADKKNTYNYLA
ncbi:Cullin family-domain-containing protein [Thamnocephalis sphaerospora]|uniref:Cullin family-domain-containing protein n=1 Tax=Thamnocephalis sphaerospora TaxID=78915 RepID=A0A4P9XJ32_9FUNG|nr:Cullin family-domain-containing protein [Thamnocephalis sphaerospora]|eukprot:RKP05744.1 Cullin family-domain-containing protein [Thamnocephalis sphaerospora]